MVEVNYDFQTFFDNKNWRGLKQALNEYDSIQIAEILEDLDENEEIIIFRLLSREQAKEVFQLFSQDKQEDITYKMILNQTTEPHFLKNFPAKFLKD